MSVDPRTIHLAHAMARSAVYTAWGRVFVSSADTRQWAIECYADALEIEASTTEQLREGNQC